jgi:hypothetical protein
VRQHERIVETVNVVPERSPWHSGWLRRTRRRRIRAAATRLTPARPDHATYRWYGRLAGGWAAGFACIAPRSERNRTFRIRVVYGVVYYCKR